MLVERARAPNTGTGMALAVQSRALGCETAVMNPSLFLFPSLSLSLSLCPGVSLFFFIGFSVCVSEKPTAADRWPFTNSLAEDPFATPTHICNEQTMTCLAEWITRTHAQLLACLCLTASACVCVCVYAIECVCVCARVCGCERLSACSISSGLLVYEGAIMPMSHQPQ